MYYFIVSRHCPKMQQELGTALQGRKDIQVILDRRYGERRAGREPIATERRRKDRRHAADMLASDRSSDGA